MHVGTRTPAALCWWFHINKQFLVYWQIQWTEDRCGLVADVTCQRWRMAVISPVQLNLWRKKKMSASGGKKDEVDVSMGTFLGLGSFSFFLWLLLDCRWETWSNATASWWLTVLTAEYELRTSQNALFLLFFTAPATSSDLCTASQLSSFKLWNRRFCVERVWIQSELVLCILGLN